MWRAWGIILLVLSQDLGHRVFSQDHELALSPPAGWKRQVGTGPTLAKFTQPGESKIPAELMITHLHSVNPTPVSSFRTQAKDDIARKFKDHQVLEEKELTLAGRPAFRLIFAQGDVLHFKTVVFRSLIEYYFLDGVMARAEEAKVRPLIEKSIATFEIVPTPLTGEEKAAEGRGLDVLKSARLQSGLLDERWYSIHLGTKKIGHMRSKLAEAAGQYVFESDVASDYGEGNKDATLVRGSFSPDGKSQKIDLEQTKINPKERWQFRASVSVLDGQMKATRDLNGVKEEKTLRAEEGVLLSDVADLVRGMLVGAGKGTYLLKTISPFADEWNVEMVEIGIPEKLDVDGKQRDVVLVQARVDRRRTMTYYYSPDRWLIRLGGPKDMFSIRASTKEEALKP